MENRQIEIGAFFVSYLPRDLLSLALRVKWDVGYVGEKQALRNLVERNPGLETEAYAEAYARACALASVGEDQLRLAHPGFADGDYAEAISKNLLWASK
jgi:hypothetical protein